MIKKFLTYAIAEKSKMSVKEIVITCVLGTALWGPIAYKMFF